MLRRAAIALAVLVTTLTVSGCGALRLETQDPPVETADEQEQLRQEHAEQSWALAELALSAAAKDPDIAPLLEAVAQDAQTQLVALGGIWRPSGRHLAQVAPVGDAADVLEALIAGAADALEAGVAADGDTAGMLAGIALSRSLRADQLAVALGAEPGALEPAMPAALDATSAGGLARTLDALGQAWEIVAARAEDATAARAEAERRRTAAQRVAEIAGLADTAEDPRSVSYDLDTTDLSVTIEALEADLVPWWLAQVPGTSGDDRRAVIDLALAAARDAGMAAPEAAVPPIVGA